MPEWCFFLGTHRPNWLALTDVPLFVSHGTLGTRRTLPRALGPWCLDSRGFTELSTHGHWTISVSEYIAAARRYMQEIGQLVWAAPQDWMCEPWVIQKTGLSVAEHQARTISSVLDLRQQAPDVPWVPVLQGWHPDDYYRHAEAYLRAGIDLTKERVVGLGTVCRRQATALVETVIQRLWSTGIRLHGFGMKTLGLPNVWRFLVSADSMAWSFHARMNPAPCPAGSTTHKNCANCLAFALLWRSRTLGSLKPPAQLRMAF